MNQKTLVAITTTKTARAQGAQEYWLKDHNGDEHEALQCARKAHPRKRKFYRLYSLGGFKYVAEEFTLDKR